MTFVVFLCLFIATLFAVGIGCYGFERDVDKMKPLPLKHYWWYGPFVAYLLYRWYMLVMM